MRRLCRNQVNTGIISSAGFSRKESRRVSRVKDLQKYVHKVLKGMDDNQKRAAAIAHLHGVSLAAVMIAKKRGENAELAAMAGLLHDL